MKKAPTPSPELQEAAETLIAAKAFVQTIKPVVDEYRQKILNTHRFEIAPEHRERRYSPEDFVILDERFTYLMSDEDAQKYFKLLQEQHIKHGFSYLLQKYDDWETNFYCPLLIAESMEREARTALIEASKYIHGIDQKKVYKIDALKKIADLTLRYVAPFLDAEKMKAQYKPAS
tara:strand:- start:9047 stop:9571 length:525 start_codon:yes stop_codon:yes gene_type:complete